MHKRKRIEVITMTKTKDGFGGWTEGEVVESVFYGFVEKHVEVLNEGHNVEHQAWVKSHTKVGNPKEKLFKIDGEFFKVVQAVQNRRRWYYQIEGE